MTEHVLLDAGPLVAIVSQRDEHHAVCVEQLRELRPPLLTCWPVLTEAAWLLRRNLPAVHRLLHSGQAGLFRLLEIDESALPWLTHFMRRYAKLGPQLADACLVYLAEREGIHTIFTLDRRAFTVYRFRGSRSVQVLPEV